MMRPTLAFLGILLCAGPAVAEEETTRQRGKHFEVVLHFESKRCAREALEVVEALWTHAAEFYDLRERKPEKLLEVHLYRDIADYEAAEAKLTKGAFKRNLAFAHFDTKSAHVSMQPEVSDDVLQQQGLPLQTRNLLAHEAAHVVRYAMLPNFRDHPDWFEDGAAQWLKYETLLGLKLIDGIEEDPMSSRAIGRVQKALADGRLPSVAALLEDKKGDLDFYERYAARRLLVTYLTTGDHKPRFAKFRKALRRMGGGRGYTTRAHARLREAFGAKAYGELEAGFQAWVRERKPQWYEIYRSLDARGSTWRQSAFSGKNAIAWRTADAWPKPAGGKAKPPAYRLTGELEIIPSYGKQMNLLLGKSDAGFISVAFTAGYGLNVFDFNAKTNRWNRLASVKCPDLEHGKRVRFQVRIEGGKLLGAVGPAKHKRGVEFEVAIPAHHPMNGPWGVGAQKGTSGVWYGVKQEPGVQGGK